MNYTNYTPESSSDYSQHRQEITSTDGEAFEALDRIGGVQDKSVLDFGCGDGHYSREFVKQGAKQVVGIDPDETFIELARQASTMFSDGEPEDNERLSFVRGDGNALPFKDGSFDIVFSNFVLHHFKDTLPAFQESRRVLRDGGRVVSIFNIYQIDKEYEDFLLGTEVPVLLGKDKKISVRPLIQSKERIVEDIKQAGFTNFEWKEIENPDATIDPEYQYYDKVKKICVVLVAEKTAE